MDNLIGKILDNRYEILDVVGQGGMSVVYRAKCHRLNRMVAVKVLKDEFSRDDEFKNRFQDESLSVAMLSHPNIVAVYDVSKAEDMEYIVMELIDGITLKEYLQKKGHLSWQETVYFALQIAKALQHAHNRGIIHRDIKPQNIMVLRDGTAKVADFGIAHQVSKQQTYNKGEAIGSVHYISPEQAKGSRIDNRADIYSLGVVMYEMLTGRLPFEGTNPVDVAIQHINSVPLNPRDYIKDIPEAIEIVTMKAMNPKLSARYMNADELIADLDKIRNNPHVKIEVDQEIAEDIAVVAGEGATQKLNYQSDIEKMKTKTKKIEKEKQGPVKIIEEDEPEEVEENDEKEGFFSRYGGVLFNIAAILLFIYGAFYFVVNVLNPFAMDGDSTLKAPDLIGEEYNKIIELEEYDKFNIVEGESMYHDTVPAGCIIDQTPKAGRTVDDNEVITVIISRGTKNSTLPDYTGKEYRQVEIDLGKLGVEYREEWEFNEEVEKNCVISTTPGVGTSIEDDLTVVLLISKGKELKEVTMPDLKNYSQEDAVAELKKLNLGIGEIKRVDSKEQDGVVIFQSIPAKSKVLEETVVDLQISRNVTPKKVAKIITLPVSNYGNDFLLSVYVNGELQYDSMHSSVEGTVEVPLVAYEGYNRVKVVVSGDTVLNEDMMF
ncbi:MAG: Stk1 family PASTA domain-containing Ser/Thr kinase [Clostridia bacterium]|nr:Stk1 family PASTA domain-containing Ser/Thr kinase [Clostridia bacterium]